MKHAILKEKVLRWTSVATMALAFCLLTLQKANAISLPIDYAVLSNQTIEDPDADITGNIHSNNQIQFSGSPVVNGNVSAVNGFTGLSSATITGTTTSGAGTFVAIPTLADILASVGPYTTINGNLTLDSAADLLAYPSGTYYVTGDIHFGGTGTYTLIAGHNIETSSGASLTSFFGGLAAYAANALGLGGIWNGSAIADNVDIHTGASITGGGVAVPDGGSTLVLMGLGLLFVGVAGRRLIPARNAS
jgi:hypothetical protein